MKRLLSACLTLGLAGCASAGARTPAASPAASGADSVSRLAPDETNPFPSTYRPLPSQPTLIRGGTVMTAAGQIIPNGQVLLVV
jgi:hypothetical protein